MGIYLSQLFEAFRAGGEPTRILMLGLDAAGKTTILYKLKVNETVSTIPTIGFNVETVEPVSGVKFTVWDIGGQGKIRGLWKPYFKGSQGLLFVVDCADRERLSEARREMFGVLEADEMRNVPVVVLANKQDMPNALKPSEIIECLELRRLTAGHRWHVQGTCATSGEGLYESMETMSELSKEFRKNSL